MRVGENREVQVRPACEQLLGVLRLGPLGAVEHGSVAGVVREPAGQLVCDPGAHVGMQHPERPNRRPVTRDPVHDTGAPVLLGQPIAVGYEGAASRHVELGFPRMEGDAQVVDEEVAAPAVVVAAHERDRHAARPQGVELRDGGEVTARDHRAVLEPEIEQVAVDEERVAEIGHRVEEPVKRDGDRGRDLGEMSVSDDDHTSGGEGHGPQARNRGEASQALSCPGVISSITLHVNYSETDQMGVVYHANYLIWFDRARTELMRETGLTYKELEQQGVYLAVSEVNVRYRAAARYDDLVRVRCWVRELASRRVTFGYAVVRRQAALAAGRIGDPQAVEPLVAALADSGPAVQAALAFALGLVKSPRAIAPLLALARAVPAERQGPPQTEAVTAIGKTGGDEGAAALGDLLGSGSATTAVQRTALLEAWRLGARAPIPTLMREARNSDPVARRTAIYALARLRPSRGVGRRRSRWPRRTARPASRRRPPSSRARPTGAGAASPPRRSGRHATAAGSRRSSRTWTAGWRSRPYRRSNDSCPTATRA